MDKLISLNKGIRRQPSVGADGELSECVNLIPRGGELVNVRGMEEADSPLLMQGERFVKVHKIQDKQIFIVIALKEGEYRFKYYMYSGTKPNGTWVGYTLESFKVSKESSAEVVGNTIVVLSDDATHYLLWNGSEYKYLGTHMPELHLLFGLQGEMTKSDTFEIGLHSLGDFDPSSKGTPPELSEGDKNALSEYIIPRVNAFISEKATNVGKFLNPFFVRYAYRLYDGRLLMHSAPILMVCSSDPAPQCFVTKFTKLENLNSYNIELSISAMLHTLDYAVGDSNGIERLSLWKDIVKSVDVFISSPVGSYDRNGKCERIELSSLMGNYSICKNVGQKISEDILPLRYQKSDFAYLYATTFSSDIDNMTIPAYRVPLPKRSEDEFRRELSESSMFYLLKSINIEELSTERTAIAIKENLLNTLVTRELMTDDSISHDSLVSKQAYVYNDRLNMFDVKRVLFNGFRNDTMQTYTNGYVYKYGDGMNPKFYANTTNSLLVYYYIREEGKEYVVEQRMGSIGHNTPLLWLYHPNRNVYKALVGRENTWCEVKMEPHPLLGGSFCFYGWDGIPFASSDGVSFPDVSEDKSVLMHNVVFSSEIGNPFFFSEAGIYKVGVGRILGVSTAVKALSQGQFGQFPLYAFCEDGIWALEVSSDGTFSTKQPVSRDVCNNPKSITQVDNAVVFTTDKGLMMLSGAEAVLLSDVLNGHNVKESDYWSAGQGEDKGLFAGQGEDKGLFAGQGEDERFDELVQDETRDIRDILRSCTIAYDYANQLLRIFPEDDESGKPYKYYVFSLESREYATVISDEGVVSGVVAGYPSSMVQIGTKLYRPKERDDEELKLGMLLTRPMTLDEPYALKKLIDLKLHYSKHDVTSRCKVMMHVSNDGAKWMRLTGLRKRSYKYYRFSIITKMKDMDALSGIVLRYDVERANRMR
jgi:hypothetical protein